MAAFGANAGGNVSFHSFSGEVQLAEGFTE